MVLKKWVLKVMTCASIFFVVLGCVALVFGLMKIGWQTILLSVLSYKFLFMVSGIVTGKQIGRAHV